MTRTPPSKVTYVYGGILANGWLKRNPEHIVADKTSSRTLYYMYKDHLHPKNIPTMWIEMVNVHKPWMIIDTGGFEQVGYLLQKPNNQFYTQVE